MPRSRRPLTVGLPTSSFLPATGGAEVGLHNIASRLQARGHRPIVMARWGHVAGLQRTGWSLPYEVVAFPPRLFPALRRAPSLTFWALDRVYRRWKKRFEIDVWHATFGFPVGATLVHAARTSRASLPHLVRCVGDDIQIERSIGYGMRLDPRVDKIVRTWLPQADMLAAVSETVADEYRALGASDERIAHIPNGVDTRRFGRDPEERCEIRRRLGIEDHTFVFLAVGRHHAKKNFEQLLRVFPHLSISGQTLLIIAGAGVDRLRMPDTTSPDLDIRLLTLPNGSAEDGGPPTLPTSALVDLYAAADSFLMPSKIETFGIVLVEAMASGLPVITTDAPGCRDVVRAEQDGLQYSVDDDDQLLRHMQAVRSDQTLRDRLASHSLRRAQRFDWDAVVDEYIAAYHRLMYERDEAPVS